MTEHLTGFFAPWLICAAILGLHLVLPAKGIDGYVRNEETGAMLRYRLNGPVVFIATVESGLLAPPRRLARSASGPSPHLPNTPSDSRRWRGEVRAASAAKTPRALGVRPQPPPA